jgi:hypothetical protein
MVELYLHSPIHLDDVAQAKRYLYSEENRKGGERRDKKMKYEMTWQKKRNYTKEPQRSEERKANFWLANRITHACAYRRGRDILTAIRARPLWVTLATLTAAITHTHTSL